MATPKPLATLDLAEGAALIGNSQQVAKELLGMLIDSLPQDLLQLKQLHDKNDIKNMQVLIHKCYGGLCYCGAPKLRALGKSLEAALKEKQHQAINELVPQFIAEGEALLQAWKKYNDNA